MRAQYLLALAACFGAAAQNHPGANFDEAKVPKYTLPALLTLANGQPVTTPQVWLNQRRPEILKIYQTEVFGRSPAAPARLDYEVAGSDAHALGGRAIRKQIAIYFAGPGKEPKAALLLYLPAAAPKPVPVFLALSFAGNQSVYSDPGVKLGEEWVRDPATRQMIRRTSKEESRGASAGNWQLDQILAHGYGLATIYCGDIEPDFDGGMPHGVRQLFLKPGPGGVAGSVAPDEWGAIGAWAWGLSRAMDYLEKDKNVDAKRVAVFGHSRLGKTALWAGAQDTRFSIVISNESGEGGAAISRRDYGERTTDLNTHFPYWFCANFRKYNDREDQMPFDSHMLLALIAPRALYVASAEGDQWSDPKGEFLGAANASPVWTLLGKTGLGTFDMPPLDRPIQQTVAYHIRPGNHSVTAYDWEQYLKFADIQWGAK
ncbi:MAG: alpha/beta hydrolase family protein [Bryobacteraceae bacterium]